MNHRKPPDYDTKFEGFIKLCEAASANKEGNGTVIVAKPWVLGDTYDEIIESLSRIADARLALRIAGR